MTELGLVMSQCTLHILTILDILDISKYGRAKKV